MCRLGGRWRRLCAVISGGWQAAVQKTPEGFGTERGVFLGGVEARTLLYPLARLNGAVSVQVGAEVTMTADGTFGVDDEQLADEEA